VEAQDPIPREWKGQLVKIMPLTPDDPLPDLEEWLATLHALGPMEFQADERKGIEEALEELDRVSKAAISGRRK
jgi:hypothetical protein